jgi:hypothetical protein
MEHTLLLPSLVFFSYFCLHTPSPMELTFTQLLTSLFRCVREIVKIESQMVGKRPKKESRECVFFTLFLSTWRDTTSYNITQSFESENTFVSHEEASFSFTSVCLCITLSIQWIEIKNSTRIKTFSFMMTMINDIRNQMIRVEMKIVDSLLKSYLRTQKSRREDITHSLK